MATNLIKATADLLADYLNFWFDFARTPRQALDPYKKKSRIDPNLISYLLLGIGWSWLISLIANALGTVDDPSDTLAFIAYFEIDVLPFVVLMAILMFTFAFHIVSQILWTGIGRLGEWLSPKQQELFVPRLGSVEDSLNGALAFIAFVSPLVTFALSLLLVLAARVPTEELFTTTMLIGIIFADFIIFAYFIAAQSAVHDISMWTVWLMFAGFVFVLTLLTAVIPRAVD